MQSVFVCVCFVCKKREHGVCLAPRLSRAASRALAVLLNLGVRYMLCPLLVTRSHLVISVTPAHPPVYGNYVGANSACAIPHTPLPSTNTHLITTPNYPTTNQQVLPASESMLLNQQRVELSLNHRGRVLGVNEGVLLREEGGMRSVRSQSDRCDNLKVEPGRAGI